MAKASDRGCVLLQFVLRSSYVCFNYVKCISAFVIWNKTKRICKIMCNENIFMKSQHDNLFSNDIQLKKCMPAMRMTNLFSGVSS